MQWSFLCSREDEFATQWGTLWWFPYVAPASEISVGRGKGRQDSRAGPQSVPVIKRWLNQRRLHLTIVELLTVLISIQLNRGRQYSNHWCGPAIRPLSRWSVPHLLITLLRRKSLQKASSFTDERLIHDWSAQNHVQFALSRRAILVTFQNFIMSIW